MLCNADYVDYSPEIGFSKDIFQTRFIQKDGTQIAYCFNS